MSTKKKPNHDILDIFPGVMELAELLRVHPKHIDKDKVKRGDELLIFYEDPSFKNSFKGLREQKIRCIEAICRDIAEGGEILQSSTVGVAFASGKMQFVTVALGTTPPGNMVFTVGWRSKRAFHAWRNEGGTEINQDDTNAILYRLSVVLSKVIAGTT